MVIVMHREKADNLGMVLNAGGWRLVEDDDDGLVSRERVRQVGREEISFSDTQLGRNPGEPGRTESIVQLS